jgi:hypothetical protein
MSDGGQCILSPFYLHPIFLVKDDVNVILLLGVSSWTQSCSASLGSRDLGAEKFTLIYCRLSCNSGLQRDVVNVSWLANRSLVYEPTCGGRGGELRGLSQ